MAPTLISQTSTCHVHCYPFLCYVLGQAIGEILHAFYLDQLDISTSYFLLNPQQAGVQMADFSDPQPPGHAHRGSGVGSDLERKAYAQVAGDGAEANGLGNALGNARELCLPRAKGERGLR